MARTAADLTADELARYRATAQRRAAARELALAQRRARAEALARQAAALLKEKFGVTRVALFGSLAHACQFTETSDIDLAVWGLPPEVYFRALVNVQDLTSEFVIDLVDVDDCKPSLRESILEEGVAL